MASFYRAITAAAMLLTSVAFGVVLKDGARDSYHWMGLAGFGGMALMLCYRLVAGQGGANA